MWWWLAAALAAVLPDYRGARAGGTVESTALAPSALARTFASEGRPRIFVATPAWHEELATPVHDQYSVPFWLHRHLLRHPLRTSSIAEATLYYVAVYVHTGELTAGANTRAQAWLKGRSATLDLLGGGKLNLTKPLASGRVFLASCGPLQRPWLGPITSYARLVYYDKFFGVVRAPAFDRGGETGTRPRSAQPHPRSFSRVRSDPLALRTTSSPA